MSVVLKEHLKNLGHNSKEIKSLLQHGKVFYCSVPTADGRRLVDASKIDIRPRAPRIKVGRDPVIVHRAKGYVVVYKPANYLSVRAPYRHKDPNILGFVYSLFNSAYAVHRLDEETSGLMLVATTETMQNNLKELLENRLIERKYLAICGGYIQKPLHVDTMFIRNRGDGKRGSTKKQDDQARRAISHFKPMEKLHKATLVEATLETGRTHQIRIHLSENNHAILGDKLYGSRHSSGKSNRLALHASTLGFNDPSSAERLSFLSPLADDLERLRRMLEFQKSKG
jgi:23S rRNA pseudouridine1911/1915/1917 synthase